MKTKLFKDFPYFYLLLVLIWSSFSQAKIHKDYALRHIVSIEISSSINAAVLSHLKAAYKNAEETKDSALLIKLNTPGGFVSTTKHILSEMGEAKVPTIIWITPESASATSAGAIIASGAHFLFMSRGTNIGAATPIGMSSGDLGEDIRKKAINDLVALVSSLSETRGRSPKHFAKMIENASSYTSKQAKKKNIINHIVDDVEDISLFLKGQTFNLHGISYKIKVKKPKIIPFEMDLGQKILSFFADPNMAYILFLLGALLIYFELQAPGILVPGAIGVLFLLLSGISFQVLPLNLGALFLLILAFLLFILEAYITSYGFLSLLGIVSLVLGSLFLFRTEDSDLAISQQLILASSLGIASFLAFLAAFLFKDIKKSKNQKDNYYSLSNKTVRVTKSFGFDKTLQKYKYLIRFDGEIWTAYSKIELMTDSTATIIKENEKDLSFLIK